MHQNFSCSLLVRYRSINDLESSIGDLRDGRRNRVAQGESIVGHLSTLAEGFAPMLST